MELAESGLGGVAAAGIATFRHLKGCLNKIKKGNIQEDIEGNRQKKKKKLKKMDAGLMAAADKAKKA